MHARAITAHQVSPLDNALSVYCVDEPGHGGASHQYLVLNAQGEPSSVVQEDSGNLKVDYTPLAEIKFQNGPIKESGVNGVSHEVLIAVVMDRLQGFQSGPYASPDNQEALEHLEKALEALQRRTRERLARNVEGTSHV